jgi:hypothetical protein
MIGTSILSLYFTYQSQNEEAISFMQTICVYVNYISVGQNLTIDYKLELAQLLTNFSNIEDYLYSEIGPSLEQCSVINDLFNNKEIPIDSLGSFAYKNTDNLYDFIEKYRQNAESLLNKTDWSATANSELFYVLQNGMFRVYRQLSTDLVKINDCITNWIVSFTSIHTIILIVQLSVLALYLLIQAFQVCTVIKIQNSQWTKLSKHTFEFFYEIRDKCVNRLTNFLNTSEEEISLLFDYTKGSPYEFTRSFSQVWAYIWSALLFGLLTLCYLLVFYFAIDSKLNEIAIQSNELKLVLFERNSLILQTNFWTISQMTQLVDNGLNEEYLNKTIEDYIKTRYRIRESKYKQFIYGSAYDYIYNSYPFNEYSRTGLYNYNEAAIIDSYYLANTKEITDLDKYSSMMKGLFDLNNKTIQLVIDNSQVVIYSRYINCMIAVVVYSVFSLVLFLSFYLPFLSKRSSHIWKMAKLAKLFIKND